MPLIRIYDPQRSSLDGYELSLSDDLSLRVAPEETDPLARLPKRKLRRENSGTVAFVQSFVGYELGAGGHADDILTNGIAAAEENKGSMDAVNAENRFLENSAPERLGCFKHFFRRTDHN